MAAVRINFAASGTPDVLVLTRARSPLVLDASKALFYAPSRWLDGTTEATTRPHGVSAEKQFLMEWDWFVVVEISDSHRSIVRRIVSFRRQNGTYRRSVEVHSLRRHKLGDVKSMLREAGSKVSIRNSYHKKPLGKGHVVVIGRKGRDE